MAVCRGCGAGVLRTLSRYDGHMNLLGEVCIVCSPGSFEVYRDPSDKKVYLGTAARPQSYKTYRINGEDVLFAKDELIADTEDAWSGAEQDRKLDQIRRTKRRDPLTPDEIRAAENWGFNVLRPELERQLTNRRYAHVDE